MPAPSAQSVLKARLSYQGSLTPEDAPPVAKLEADSGFVEKRQVGVDPGAATADVIVLRSGRAATRFGAYPHRSTITRLYLPGDVIGLTELAVARHPYQVTMVSDSSLTLVSRGFMLQLARDNSRPMARLTCFDQIDSVATREQFSYHGVDVGG